MVNDDNQYNMIDILLSYVTLHDKETPESKHKFLHKHILDINIFMRNNHVKYNPYFCNWSHDLGCYS